MRCFSAASPSKVYISDEKNEWMTFFQTWLFQVDGFDTLDPGRRATLLAAEKHGY
jgi:hypothetical protein